VLGFYAYLYELAAKALTSFTKVLTGRQLLPQAGDAVNVLRERHGVQRLNGYFDSFLPNAMDHPQYNWCEAMGLYV
jgi:hypothetical protein